MDGDDEEMGAVSNTAAAASSLTPQERAIQVKLGQGAYHLPGNSSATQDFLQYIRNNHPLFAVCCESPLHPISKSMRAVGLLGSVMMGLILTNIFYMWQLYEQNNNEHEIIPLPDGKYAITDGVEYHVVEEGTDGSVAAEYLAPSFEMSSTSLILLWTVGSAVHSLFDTFLWYATSCACCPDACHQSTDNAASQNKKSRFIVKSRKYCNALIVVLVVLAMAAATLAVVIRAMIQGNENSMEDILSVNGSAELQELLQNNGEAVSDQNNYRFLEAYAIELALSWFVWFFVFEAIFFTGILSCGGRCLPSLLGGRPAELKEEEEAKRKAEAKLLRQSKKRRSSASKKPKKKRDSKTRRTSKT